MNPTYTSQFDLENAASGRRSLEKYLEGDGGNNPIGTALDKCAGCNYRDHL